MQIKTRPSHRGRSMLSSGMLILLKREPSMNFLLHMWQSDIPSASQGKTARHVSEQLLCTFNYSLSWKMQDPGVFCNYVLYRVQSPEFYLIAHYVETIANCCCFVQVISNSAVSHTSRGETIQRVENVNSPGRLLNIVTQRRAMQFIMHGRKVQ